MSHGHSVLLTLKRPPRKIARELTIPSVSIPLSDDQIAISTPSSSPEGTPTESDASRHTTGDWIKQVHNLYTIFMNNP